MVGDKGYVGIEKYSKECLIGIKKKNGYLSQGDLRFNRMVARTRIVNEHVIGSLKRFRCLSGKFRHCKDIIGRVLSLAIVIAGFHNFELIH